ncbi:hypothetical protein ACOSQ4_004710 [Xanthoceras sorbifolium]
MGLWGDWLKKNGNRVQLTWKPIERLHKIFNLCIFSHDYQIHSTFLPNLFLAFLLQPLFKPFFQFLLCASYFFSHLANSFHICIFLFSVGYFIFLHISTSISSFLLHSFFSLNTYTFPL